MRFLLHGNGERLKGTVHGAAELLAAVMGLYNGTALAYRVCAGEDGTPAGRFWQNRHLAANLAVYAAAYAWERRKRKQHEKARQGA
jgi:hypothetical protein